MLDIYLLGAGRPTRGRKPSALKQIALGSRALDWQIRSFSALAAATDIHFLGGYDVDEVIASYPQLNFTVVPDWEHRTVLHTLLRAPFGERPALISYADTLFRHEVIATLLSHDADVVFGVDSLWRNRYVERTVEDAAAAETLEVEIGGELRKVEFTGLIYLSPRAVAAIARIDEATVGRNLVDLIAYFARNGLSSQHFDVLGEWAELDAPGDIARFVLGSKAATLARLEPVITKSHIGSQFSFSADMWRADRQTVLGEIAARFPDTLLIVRSSARGEDNWETSNAGGFKSLLNIDSADADATGQAVDEVFASYGAAGSGDDLVLVQKCIDKVRFAGVVFTCLLDTGAPYYRFNFDDSSASTESVTAGTEGDLRTVIVSRYQSGQLTETAPELVPVLEATQELEHLLGFHKLDVEFAVDMSGQVHIFQVRPITVDHSNYEAEDGAVEKTLRECVSHFRRRQTPSPFIFGSKTIFANMPDWNPAEIVGTRPKPLALSLYRHLITDEIWARQRAEFGYRDIRPSPLIYSFAGQPYVDARASLNSFVPASLPDETARRLCAAYIAIFDENPHLHDKIEFEVAFTVWTPGLADAARARLLSYGVTDGDIELLEVALKGITRSALTRLEADTAPIEQMVARQKAIEQSGVATLDRVHLLIEDCKAHGTLAFSHAARAGFVATTLLKNFVASGVLSDESRQAFLRSFQTVAGDLDRARQSYASGEISMNEMVETFGHLRPGTYDLSRPAYWEDPERYLIHEAGQESIGHEPEFAFSETARVQFRAVLDELGSPLPVDNLIAYLRQAIQARERVKFLFTRNLSRALDGCVELGKTAGFSREEMGFLEYPDLERLRLNSMEPDSLRERIEDGRRAHALTSIVELPSLIAHEGDLYSFEYIASQPNYITTGKVEGTVRVLKGDEDDNLTGKIVLIAQADPGYDWLFGHGIAGLITKYGGANSHMAIRAAEIGLPAAIGVGEKLYELIADMGRIELDCANRNIRRLQ